MDVSDRKACGRSKYGNGHLLIEVDGRSSRARRMRDLINGWERQLPHVDEAQRLLLKRCASLVVLLEGLDEIIGQPHQDIEKLRPMLEDYRRGSGQLYRLLRGLGLLDNKPPINENGDALEHYLARQYGMADIIPGAPDHHQHAVEDDSGSSRVAAMIQDLDDDDEVPPRRRPKTKRKAKIKRRSGAGES